MATAFSIDLQNQVLLAQTSATKEAINSTEPMLLVAYLSGNAKKTRKIVTCI